MEWTYTGTACQGVPLYPNFPLGWPVRLDNMPLTGAGRSQDNFLHSTGEFTHAGKMDH